MKPPILIADDDPDVISALSYLLNTEGYSVTTAGTPKEVESCLSKKNFELLLMDLNYSKDTTSGKEGLELIPKVKKVDDELPIVVMTAWGSIETAVEAMQKGAGDFIQKPWENDRLLSVIKNQILLGESKKQTHKLAEENLLLRNELGLENIQLVSNSPIMLEFMGQLNQVASSDANVLLTGENGTGKSLLAQCIHHCSMRKDQPLISVNMGSISESLFESEMFGHVKGAFTDARENRMGRFELADKGTLFLDEIGNTPFSQQAKLLRVLEEHQFEKVGSSITQQSDCRLISATNCDLDEAVNSERFRKDLFYRINTVTLRVPSLRERKEDIVPLADFFLHTYGKKYNKPEAKLDEKTLSYLQSYYWPGNIRELSHVIERAIILSGNKEISIALLGINTALSPQSDQCAATFDTESTLDQIEKGVFIERLNIYRGNGMETAKSLGLSKSAFYRRLEKHNL